MSSQAGTSAPDPDRGPKPKIDLEKVPGTDHHRTAVTFNCFIMKMLDILNNFGNQMEEMLEKAERSLTTADRKLRLMEVKLSAVQLDGEDAPKAGKTKEVERKATEAPSVVPETPKVVPVALDESASPPEAPKPPEAAPRTISAPEAPVPATRRVILIKDDPAYSKYFKMLKMGVPEAGVTQKMASEGVDPAILKRGDEPSRYKDQTSEASESEEPSSDSE